MINTEDLTVHGDISVGCVNSHFVPCIDETYDLGTLAKNWRHLYIKEILSKDPLIIDQEGIGNNTGNVTITDPAIKYCRGVSASPVK